MRIDTRHIGESSVVLIELETESEVRSTDEHLARVAFSQDRLRWLEPTTRAVCAKSAKLRRLPRHHRFAVSKLGAAALVVITDA